VDTSMGFTPLEGMVMGTRSGDIDPAIVTFLESQLKVSADDVITILNKKSGLMGTSGVSSDFRDLFEAANSGNKKAKTAIDMLIYRITKYIGGYAAAMNGVDVIVFAGGIGENAIYVREQVLKGLTFLGVDFDEKANDCRGETVKITKDGSKVTAFVIPTDEEMVIARDTMELSK
ncbi:MAG: acetate kinase, partial [Clostridia bacterium]|nr:acetate kinase [Clostridia bacterium]